MLPPPASALASGCAANGAGYAGAVPQLGDYPGVPIVLALGVLLFGWYFVGNEVMRRRAHRLAIWAKHALDPFGGKQSIRWFSGQAFRLEVDNANAPLKACALTGLTESWDVPFVWGWNRLRGRRDMLLLQATLRHAPPSGLEVYRPGTILAGDAAGFARQEDWPSSAHERFVVAAPGDRQRELALALLATLVAEQPRLVRLALRRQPPHLTLALNVPDPARFEPRAFTELVRRLADCLQAA